jgi:hypothetical protein
VSLEGKTHGVHRKSLRATLLSNAERMMEIQKLIERTKRGGAEGGLNPREVIATQASIREQLRALNDDLEGMTKIHDKDKRKRPVSRKREGFDRKDT